MRQTRCALLVYLLLCTVSSQGFCQALPVASPVHWEKSIRRTADKQYILTLTGTISEGWHVYAQEDTTLGLLPLAISWENEAFLEIPDAPAANAPRGTDFSDPVFGHKKLKVYTGRIQLEKTIAVAGAVPDSLAFSITGFASDNKNFIPLEEKGRLALEGGSALTRPLRLASIDLDHPATDCGEKSSAGQGLFSLFLLGFGGGLLALLTPCIFPMIPVAVSYFTGRATTRKQGIRNALAYAGYIFGIYTLASAPFHLLGNISPQLFNNIATNAGVNLFFFVLFIVFALSFFGLFELRLPAILGNHSANKTGIFFMALTLVIVSFSCTGIILGSLLVNALSANGNAWQLTSGMAGFGAALALPFGLFALFPHWLKQLPRSGDWFNTVKKTLAFVELGLAVKYFSNADLVEHWGILKRETFIGSWLLVALGLAVYLFGGFDKKAGGEKPRLSAGRRFLGIATLLFAAYLVPGLLPARGRSLEFLSGFPPPLSYSLYANNDRLSKTLQPDVINDYEKALAMARQQGKPLLIDFTGWACINCRKMEEQVWSKPGVQQLIRENFILLSLYVDDRKKMAGGGSQGEHWAAFQAANFGQVTQPLYVIINTDEKLMNHPVGYTPKESDYRAWLECGRKAATQHLQ